MTSSPSLPQSLFDRRDGLDEVGEGEVLQDHRAGEAADGAVVQQARHVYKLASAAEGAVVDPATQVDAEDLLADAVEVELAEARKPGVEEYDGVLAAHQQVGDVSADAGVIPLH